jgi:hypothetical protein
MTTTTPPQPTIDEVLTYFDTCSNWGRWGADDHAGTINLITPEKRREAAATVRSGRAVSLAYPWDTIGHPGNWNPAQHFVRTWPEGCVDYIGISYHGYATTHIDALCHIFWEGKMYGGRDSTLVTSNGARAASIDAWSNGITTRGVLSTSPLPRHGLRHPRRAVRGWELEAAAESEGVDLRPGDAVIVYSGRPSFYSAHHTPPAPAPHPASTPTSSPSSTSTTPPSSAGT